MSRLASGGIVAAGLIVLSGSWSGRVRAQEATSNQEAANPIEAFAQTLADSLTPRWNGPRTPWPEPRERPPSSGLLRSFEAPVVLQLGPGIERAEAESALGALERVHGYLADNGWPEPVPDGGRGGTLETDLYLLRGAANGDRLGWAGHDAPADWLGLDRADTFAVVDAAVDAFYLEACVTSAYVQAALLSWDPAEAEAWRIATGDYVAWLLTGRFGCSDAPLIAHQRQSGRGWVTAEPDSGEGGALFLALLSARTDGLSGRFIRDLWTATAQRTWEGEGLRAAPDLWEVLFAIMEVGEDPLPRLLEEMAVARYFAGSDERRAGAPIPLLRALPRGAEVPVPWRTQFEALPIAVNPHGRELEPHGSAYVEIDTSQAPPSSQLRVWLRGEQGVGWSLIAVRLTADGLERGRTRAPVRRNNARSYLPVDLTDPQIARVILVVTNMGARRVDADEPDDQVRAFRLVLDQSAPSEPAEEEAAQEEEPAEEEQAAQEEEAVPSAP